jgi:hypothetical protein
MGLDENAKAANIIGSVQQHLHTHLADVLNSSQPAIDFGGGLPFDDAPLAEWVQPRMLALARPEWGTGPFAHRTGASGDPVSRGREVLWVLNINCFVRPAKQPSPNNLRLYTVRDLVLAALLEGSRIPVKDYTTVGPQGQETIGYLLVDRLAEDRPIYDPANEDCIQHNLVFWLRWTETWTT